MSLSGAKLFAEYLNTMPIVVFHQFEAKGQAVTYLLYINLNIFLEIISIQIQHQVVDKVKAVAHDDERQLISEFSFLEREEL